MPLTQGPPVSTIEDLFPPFISCRSTSENLGYIGVDIDFESCRVGAYDQKTSTAIVLSNEHGNRSTPTYIAFTPNNILIGEDAKNQASRNVENTFFGFTALLGNLFNDNVTSTLKDHSGFQINDRNGKPAFFAPCRGKHYSAEELTAFLIKKMVRVAETMVGQAVSKVCISTHAPLNLFRQGALYEAAALAGVALGQRLRNSTSAVAFKYMSDHRREHLEDVKSLLVVDARIEGCDCSVFELDDGVLEVKGTFGLSNTDLSLDTCLSKLLCAFFHRTNPEIPLPPSPRNMVRLTRAVEEARRQLMSAKKVPINLDFFSEGVDLSTFVQQTDLEQMVDKYLVPNIRECYRRLAEHAPRQEIMEVILIGEMARLPHVRRIVKKLSRDMFATTTLVSEIDPLEYAVLGTALNHKDTEESVVDNLMLDCIGSNISITTYSTRDSSERKTIMLGLGDTEPTLKRITLFTINDHQEGALLRFFSNKEFSIEEWRLYFEVAFSLPLETRRRGHYAFVLKMATCFRSSGLDITVYGEKSSGSPDDDRPSVVLLKMHRSSTGSIAVRHGTGIPITPNIREHWRVTADEPVYKGLEGEGHVTAEGNPKAANIPNKEHRRRDKERNPPGVATRERKQGMKDKNRFTKEKTPLRSSRAELLRDISSSDTSSKEDIASNRAVRDFRTKRHSHWTV